MSQAQGQAQGQVPHYSIRDRAFLSRRVSELGETEHCEILKILQTHGISQTINRNGIFANLTAIDNAVVDEIYKFVEYCINNKNELDEYEKRINECKIRQEYTDIVAIRNGMGAPSNNCILTSNACADAYGVDVDVDADADADDEDADDADVDDVDADDAAVPHGWMDLDKKIDSAKYIQAKKKYSKRRVEALKDSSAASDGGELTQEAFLIVRPL